MGSTMPKEQRKDNVALDALICFLEFTLMLLVLIDCNSIFRVDTAILIDFEKWTLTGANLNALILIAAHLMRDSSKIDCIKRHVPLFLVLFLFTFEFGALNAVQHHAKGYYGYFLFFVNLMIVLFRFYQKDGQAFHLMIVLEHMVLFLAAVSFLLWIGACVLELWGRNADIPVNWGGFYSNSNYLNLCIRRFYLASDIKKNLGIFIEPPMYGLFLGYAFYTELFLKKKSNPMILAVLLLTLFSNRAVLALLLCMGAVFFKYLEVSEGKKYAKLLTPLLILTGMVAATALILYKRKVGFGSFATHIDDFAASLKCWTHYPILGCGFNTDAPIKEFMSEFRKHNQGLSNSAAVVLAEGGIVLFTYYLTPFLIMMLAFFRKNKKLAYWGIGMCLFWVVVIFHVRLFIFFLLAFGFSMLELQVSLKGELEGKRRIRLSVNHPCENCREEEAPGDWNSFFGREMINLPRGFVFVMAVVLVFLAIDGLLEHRYFSTRNTAVSAVLLAGEAILWIAWLKNEKITWRQQGILQLGGWFLYMLLGQPYQVIDHFYTVAGLHIQTCWWKPIVAAIILIAVGILSEKVLPEKKKKYF